MYASSRVKRQRNKHEARDWRRYNRPQSHITFVSSGYQYSILCFVLLTDRHVATTCRNAGRKSTRFFREVAPEFFLI
jgi:hypothetical protein